MADAENAKRSDDDGTLLAVEATEKVIVQEPVQTTGEADLANQPFAAPPPIPEKRLSGLLAFVVGGALLAGAGFGAARYAFPDTGAAQPIAALQTQLEALSAANLKQKSDLAALAARPIPDITLGDKLAALAAMIPDVTALDARITSLEDRLTSIETSSAAGEGAPAAALAAMARDLKDLQSQLAAQKGAGSAASAAVQARLDASQAAAEMAAKQAALSLVRAAFESGSPMAPALDGLKALGADVPAALANAGGAIPSLSSLQESFAEPARAALDASIRANMGNGWASRLTSFLRSQTGARSLTPRDGTDPDAVLSRAEAALRQGQINAALAELAGLPPEGAAAMAPWVADATRRLAAETAITDLSATLSRQ